MHGEDIRFPLGITREYLTEHLVTALHHQVKTPISMGGGKERVSGSRLVATDSVVDGGAGREVRGSTLDLLLAVSGRPVDPSRFSGEGAAAFVQQL